MRTSGERTSKVIYIPICFYYFLLHLFLTLLHNPDLHSNMFLLFLGRRCRKCPAISNIYIPICFYYFRSYHSPFLFTKCIYIPIYFYYFLVRQMLQIQSITKLHSNMFLLFPSKWYENNPDDKIIYIPICFYYFSLIDTYENDIE